MPTASVGLPVYNGERFLEIAVRSVLDQTWADFELIISDNCSTDQTEAICRAFVEQDPRVHYHRNKSNIGAAGNFCQTFTLSHGEYFRWLSADDFIAPSSIEKSIALLQANPDAVLACTQAAFVHEAGLITRSYDAGQALLQRTARERFRAVFDQDPWCNAVYGLLRRATLQRTALLGAFPGSDIALLAELATHGRFLEVPEPLFFRRIHPGAYSYGVSVERDREFYAPNSVSRSAPMSRAWRHMIANASAIIRSPAPLGDTGYMLAHVLRQAWWDRRDILREIGGWVARSR